MAGRRVLITGTGSQIGAELARRLEADPEVEYVAGLDSRPPPLELGSTDLIDADIRSPVIAKLIPPTGVDTVVHNQIVRQPGGGLSPSQVHDVNVIGSLQLLSACEQTESVKAIVIRGSAGIYGAEPAAPQFFTEDMTRLYAPRTRFQRDIAEIETYFEGFSRRHPHVVCTMLRYQPAIGPTVDSQVTRYLAAPLLPTYLGFDPRLQFVHERDGIDALVASVRNPVRGAVNVASPGTIGLTRIVRLTGKATVPMVPGLFRPAVSAGARVGMPRLSPDFERLLRYGRGVAVDRLTEEVGFRPSYTTRSAVEEYVSSFVSRRMVPSPRHVATRVGAR